MFPVSSQKPAKQAFSFLPSRWFRAYFLAMYCGASALLGLNEFQRFEDHFSFLLISKPDPNDMENNGRDYIAFFLISLPFIIFFILVSFISLNTDTVYAYAFMIIFGIVGLLLMRFYDKVEEPIYFDKNAGWYGVGVGIVLGLIVFVVNAAIYKFGLLPSSGGYSVIPFVPFKFVQAGSSVAVPQFFALSQLPSLSEFGYISNGAFEFILTAPAEELIKAALFYGLYMKWQNEPFAMGMSVFVWATFHAILVGFTLPEIMLAFLSGLIFYVGWKYTGSILTAIYAHGLYDALIIILAPFNV